MNKIIRIILAIAFLCIPATVFAENKKVEDVLKMKPGQSIIVDGDSVEFFEEQGKIVAEGNVSITYGDIRLTCDRIEVDSKAQKALCEGNVRVEQPEGVLTGDNIWYDFKKREGQIISGEVKAYPWFGRADETAQVAENEYLLRNGYISTCELEEPHYRIKAQEIRVFPNDKVIAKNAFMYIGKVPVLWFPYYYQPIINTKAKVQFIPGVNSDWGYFLLSAWRVHIKGQTKVDVLIDYRHKKGFAEGANLYYHAEDFGAPELGEGVFRSYFIHENDVGTYEKDADKDVRLRKRFKWKHRIDFDRDTVGMLEFNKMSDKDVLKDYFYNEFEENSQRSPNFASIISTKQNYSFGLRFDRRYNIFNTVTQRLPELKLEVPDQRLWETPFYYSTDLSATVFAKEYRFEEKPPEKVERFDYLHKLSYITKLGPLNLTPFGTFEETIYNRNKWKNNVITREAFGAGLNSFLRFYRIYDFETDAMGLDINGLRHIVVPSA